MARGKSTENNEILEYALGHLERERDDIQKRIDHIRRQLGSAPKPIEAAPESPATPRRKRVLSDSARRRIAAAQKKRWAEHRKKAKAA